MKWNAYLRLMRFHKPVGIILLWSPTAWALWIANQGAPPLKLVFLFLSGTIVMRAAGCVMNDIADRRIDVHVSRTRTRPLTSGEVRLTEAITLLFCLLFIALLILLSLPTSCILYALIALLVTFIYPFCKRFIQVPQLVLGIAFSLGIPMAYVASHGFEVSIYYLLIINVAWIVAYDSQYAMADRADDLRIGVKSTAILFASYDRLIIGMLQFFFHMLWLPLTYKLEFSVYFYACWLLGAFILIYQQRLLVMRLEKNCLQAFAANNWYGLILWLGIILGYFL